MRRYSVCRGRLRTTRADFGHIVLRIALSLIAVLIPVWWCIAAPILPKSTLLPDDVLSLAGLTGVRIEVEQLPRVLEEQDITIEMIEDEIRRALKGANITVVDDTEGPKLAIMLGAATDQRVPDAMGLNIRVNLYQMVTVERLNRRLYVPTFTTVLVGLEDNDNVSEAVAGGVNWAISKFLRAVQSAAVESPGGAE